MRGQELVYGNLVIDSDIRYSQVICMFRLRLSVLACTLLALSVSGDAYATPGSDSNAPIHVTKAEEQAFLSVAKFPKQLAQQKRLLYAKNALVNLHVLDRYATAHGLNENQKFRTRVSLAKLQILSGIAIHSYIQSHPIPFTDVQKEYRSLRMRAGHYQDLLSEILLNSKGEAEKVYQAIQKDPAAFSRLAREHSIDKMTASRGGVVGWESPQMLSARYRKKIEHASVAGSAGGLLAFLQL